ncbi:MAG TPA: DUF255 domain-containing protein [Thermoanaerobaculia bacterium]|jgi:uncharacterized protein YyaL (SSP411 family)|nr:DUF255 domain-containing protein [Thermoanaerobaculia bacterium]
MKRLLLLLAIALPLSAKPAIQWQTWSPDVFAQAKREHRFVLLDLEAVWCHWCHVMDEMTYSDDRVIALMNRRYIAVRVDQDSRPDLSNRYEDYGWPATIVFAADGSEIVKRSGYIPPMPMASMLQAIIDDPSPGPSVVKEPPPVFSNGAALVPKLHTELEETYAERYDAQHGGWGFVHKYLDPPSVEYALARARRGDAAAAKMARQTIDGERNLLDPAWGGVYQYSTGGVWNEPHFEKIMSMQAGNLRVASLAYALWHEPRDLAMAQAIRRYLLTFLRSPEGTFYTSQNADLVDGRHAADYFALNDIQRRAKGIPRIDKHVYARENGWAIEALATLATSSGDSRPLSEARTAADWVTAHLHRPDGGFQHGLDPATNAGGPFLADTLSMGRAFLALYAATGERIWLRRAQEAAAFIELRFRANPGYVTAPHATRQRDENCDVARFANLLHHYDGDVKHESMAKNAMRYLTAPQVATPAPVGNVLLADLELREQPLHVTVVGAKNDANARALFLAAASLPQSYKQLEWLDRAEGPLPGSKVEYPAMSKAAAFVCSSNRCSRPAFSVAELRTLVSKSF